MTVALRNQARGFESFPDIFFLGRSLFFPFSALLNTSLVQTERKTQMLGFELSGLIGEHVVHFRFESFLIVLSAKNGQRRMCKERFEEGLSTILTCVTASV